MQWLHKAQVEQISEEELHTLVGDATGGIAENAQAMLLRMLELKAAQAADVMVPRNEIYGIDISQPMPVIEKRLLAAPHRYVPLYDTYMDELRGVVSVRQALVAFAEGVLTKDKLLALAQKNYFIPETAPLNKQLVYFQNKRCNFAFVVDEYGDIQGVVTLKDILEDIIGEFEEEADIADEEIETLPDNSYLVDGMMNVRELNRLIGTQLPLGGPKTLNGLIIAYLDDMPTRPCCVVVHGVKMELVDFNDRAINQVKLYGK
jgi:Mg2+/Co2+ transporter CorB